MTLQAQEQDSPEVSENSEGQSLFLPVQSSHSSLI
jgi:hypothetical protein